MVALPELFAGQSDLLASLTDEGRKRALRLTRAKLRELRAQVWAIPSDSWDYATKQAVLQALGDLVAALEAGQLALLVRHVRRAYARGGRAVAVLLGELDRAFLGYSPALRWDTLAWYADNALKHSQVRLQVYQTSLRRYGQATVRQVSDELAKAVLTGDSWREMRPAIWSRVRGVVQDRQWMVDRIIATETSAAYNGARLEALVAEDQYTVRPADRLQKKLVATFDDRTGPDSVILHGQTVPVASPFIDALTGRNYMAPPNRPHDREIVVPWRGSYTLDLGPSYVYDAETAREADTLRDTRSARRAVLRDELVKRRAQRARLQAQVQATPDASLSSMLADQLAAVERQIALLESQLRGLV